MTANIRDDVEALFKEQGFSTETSDHARIFQALGERGWLAADWPHEAGGLEWDRETQLSFLTALARFGCPVPPDVITVVAPILLSADKSEERQRLLSEFANGTSKFEVLLDPIEDSLVIRDNTTEHIIAEAGTATELISLHGSPLWQLYEWMAGLVHIQNMARHWDEELTDEMTEMQVSLDAAVASFLMGSALSDSQLRLNASQTRLDIFSTLFQSLGYYALLDPDPELSANEPVPFRRERYHLGQLRRMIARNEMLQLDKLYERALSNDED
ncbi:MAG: acyl-CoA dehydrogenase family protein [Pseudomonadales bacterium]|nr:acyl-CoA dehydrogenase family protein [Pseudomonadales bacterium]